MIYPNCLIKILILNLYFISFKVEINNLFIGIYKAASCWKGGGNVRCREPYNPKKL